LPGGVLALSANGREKEEVLRNGLPEKDLNALQVKAREMLLSAAGEMRVSSVRTSLEKKIIPQEKYRIFSFRGSIPALFLETLFWLIVSCPDRIRRCPECERLFVRIRKQEYCSRTCVNRVNKRDWRKAQEAKAKAQKRRVIKKARTAQAA
jgi:hypothetical protein